MNLLNKPHLSAKLKFSLFCTCVFFVCFNQGCSLSSKVYTLVCEGLFFFEFYNKKFRIK